MGKRKYKNKNRKQQKKLTNPKSQLFGKLNKSDKFLARLIKTKRKRENRISVKNKKGVPARF